MVHAKHVGRYKNPYCLTTLNSTWLNSNQSCRLSLPQQYFHNNIYFKGSRTYLIVIVGKHFCFTHYKPAFEKLIK